jgi:transketolase
VRTGIVLGMRSLGVSAPIVVVAEHFGFTVERMFDAAKQAVTRAEVVSAPVRG